MTKETIKFLDFSYCFDEKILKIPSSTSIKEIKIDESTRIV